MISWLDTNTGYTAFSEGWALYAENPLIARDTNVYEKEPLQKYGMLKWQVCAGKNLNCRHLLLLLFLVLVLFSFLFSGCFLHLPFDFSVLSFTRLLILLGVCLFVFIVIINWE